MNKIIKVGTRTSKLALAQTKLATDRISKIDPSIKFEIVSINTKGDQVHHKPLRDIYEEGKGAFTSEIQQALKISGNNLFDKWIMRKIRRNNNKTNSSIL